MLEALVGLLKNSKEVINADVELYVTKHESLMYKLQKSDPAKVTEDVATRHFDSLKGINKFYTEKDNNEHYALCSPFTPLLAWANQYCYLTNHARRALKVENSIRSLENDIRNYEEKKTHD